MKNAALDYLLKQERLMRLEPQRAIAPKVKLWVTSTRIHTSATGYSPIIVFSGVPAFDSPIYYAPDAWHEIDLGKFQVKPTANFAMISGHLIITHGTRNRISNLTAEFSITPGTYGNYQMQSIEPHTQGGQRDQASITVSRLKKGKFQFQWRASVPDGKGGMEPDIPYEEGGSSYLLNLRLEMWGEP